MKMNTDEIQAKWKGIADVPMDGSLFDTWSKDGVRIHDCRVMNGQFQKKSIYGDEYLFDERISNAVMWIPVSGLARNNLSETTLPMDGQLFDLWLENGERIANCKFEGNSFKALNEYLGEFTNLTLDGKEISWSPVVGPDDEVLKLAKPLHIQRPGVTVEFEESMSKDERAYRLGARYAVDTFVLYCGNYTHYARNYYASDKPGLDCNFTEIATYQVDLGEMCRLMQPTATATMRRVAPDYVIGHENANELYRNGDHSLPHRDPYRKDMDHPEIRYTESTRIKDMTEYYQSKIDAESGLVKSDTDDSTLSM